MRLANTKKALKFLKRTNAGLSSEQTSVHEANSLSSVYFLYKKLLVLVTIMGGFRKFAMTSASSVQLKNLIFRQIDIIQQRLTFETAF
ncbi:MAG: hypothetical protein Q4F47_02720 [Bacteroidaceae bacterium]|nr:hypothetical protein [Bacteroidaceae bacterium]